MTRVLKLGFCLLVAAALVVAAAWTRAGALVGEARMQAELAAMPRAGDSAVATRVEPANDGKLVLIHGVPVLGEPARLHEGDVVAPDALVLASVVERYEKKDKKSSASWTTTSGGERAYPQLALGAFAVESALLDGLDAAEPFVLDARTRERLGAKEPYGANGVFYGSGTTGSPDVNDIRRTYFTAPNGELSVLALQRGATLARDVRTYTAPYVGIVFDVGVAARGRVGSDAMFALQQQRIREATLAMRTLGAVAVIGAGFFAWFGFGDWRGPQFGHVSHPVQFLLVLALGVAWLLVAWPLSAIERFVAPLASTLPALAVAIGVAVVALLAALVAAREGIERYNARWARDPRAGRGRRR